MFSMFLEKDGLPWLPKYKTQLLLAHLVQPVASLPMQQANTTRPLL
jgi:hypothetical protein